jgi:hypothetical protein
MTQFQKLQKLPLSVLTSEQKDARIDLARARLRYRMVHTRENYLLYHAAVDKFMASFGGEA